MFSQDRKYFCFSFSRVLVLAFMLISPTQFTQGCGKAATALSDPTDPKFVSNSVDCLNELTKVKNWKTAGELIQKLPELMEKALPVAKKGELVLLSAYLLYRSFELHDRAMNLAKWGYKKHRDEFKALEEEMIPV